VAKPKKINYEKSLVRFLYEVGTLRKIPRGHMQALYTNDLSDNIASHSFRVAMIGYFLAKLEGANRERVAAMCLFHDLPEARSGDQNYIHKRYVKVFEEEILEGQLKDSLNDPEAHSVAAEYMARKTKEAIVAKDADLLDQLLLQKEYMAAGNQIITKAWMAPKIAAMKTKSAKKLGQEIVKQRPDEWWINGLWSDKRR
jgi:putative hydrolase of HD superfamily